MLDLYILETCPYCKKVMAFMKDNDIKFNKHDVSEPESYVTLQELGGKSQVPFLIDEDNDIKMYESDDIIEYLKNKM